MRTFVTDLAAKSSPQSHLSAFKHWLFVRQEVHCYALAPAVVAIAFLARLALTPILGDASPYLIFVPADLVAGGLGGLGPGLLLAGLQSAAAVSDPAGGFADLSHIKAGHPILMLVAAPTRPSGAAGASRSQ